MAGRITYHEQTDRNNILKLREILADLPPFAKEYFRAAEASFTAALRMALKGRMSSRTGKEALRGKCRL